MADTDKIKIYDEAELKDLAMTKLRYLASRYGAPADKAGKQDELVAFILKMQKKTGGVVKTDKSKTAESSEEESSEEEAEKTGKGKEGSKGKPATKGKSSTKSTPAPESSEEESSEEESSEEESSEEEAPEEKPGKSADKKSGKATTKEPEKKAESSEEESSEEESSEDDSSEDDSSEEESKAEESSEEEEPAAGSDASDGSVIKRLDAIGTEVDASSIVIGEIRESMHVVLGLVRQTLIASGKEKTEVDELIVKYKKDFKAKKSGK